MQIVIQHSLSACFVMEGARLCLKKMAANTSPAIASTSSMTIHSGTTTNTAVADVPLPSLPFQTVGKLEGLGSNVPYFLI